MKLPTWNWKSIRLPRARRLASRSGSGKFLNDTFARCINFQFIKPPVFSINRLIVICSNEPEFICLLTDSGYFQRCFPYFSVS